MNTRRLIERLASWPATLTLCLLIVLGALAVKLWPRTVPFEQCSEVYKKYAGADGVDASFLKDYRINDTAFVDVTVLEALSDTGWAVLQEQFHLPILDEKALQSTKGHNPIFVKLVSKSGYPAECGSDYERVLASSYQSEYICVFHAKNKNEVDVIQNHAFFKSTNEENLQLCVEQSQPLHL